MADGAADSFLVLSGGGLAGAAADCLIAPGWRWPSAEGLTMLWRSGCWRP